MFRFLKRLWLIISGTLVLLLDILTSRKGASRVGENNTELMSADEIDAQIAPPQDPLLVRIIFMVVATPAAVKEFFTGLVAPTAHPTSIPTTWMQEMATVDNRNAARIHEQQLQRRKTHSGQ